MICLGVDLGTSGLKVALLDGDDLIATASRPLRVLRPHVGWSEQDPEGWWQALVACLDELQASEPAALAATAALGLSGQMHGATLLDARGQVLRPCILWNDGRSQAQCAELEARWPALRKVTGNPAMAGFTAPKLLWVREHETELFERTALVLLPKAYLRWRLTGEAIEEMSDASGTLWLCSTFPGPRLMSPSGGSIPWRSTWVGKRGCLVACRTFRGPRSAAVAVCETSSQRPPSIRALRWRPAGRKDA